MVEGKARWRLSFDNGGLEAIDLLEGPDSLPILDIAYRGDVISQLGLNVSHSKSDYVFFPELAGNYEVGVPVAFHEFVDNPKIGVPKGLNFHRYRGRVFFHVIQIMLRDSSISSLNFSKRNEFSVHVSDETLIACLKSDALQHSENRIYRMLDKCDKKPSLWLLRAISKNPGSYKTALGFLMEKEREEFHKNLVSLTREQIRQMEAATKGRVVTRSMRKGLEELDELGVNVVAVERELSRLTNSLRGFKVIPLERLGELYEEFCKEPSESMVNNPSIPYFSNVVLLPTTLHERANPGYSKEILTFKIAEPPFSMLDRRTGESTMGYKKRKSIAED